LTAARKHQGEVVFKFKGQIFLLCNGVWCPEEAFIGSDKRRHTGLTFSIKFVDNPRTLNEKEKNTNIKQHIAEYFAEFWFLARVFWLLPKPRPGSDRTTPICPNSESLIKSLTNESEGGGHELPKEVVEAFVKEHLRPYALGVTMPSKCSEIEGAFKKFVEIETNTDVLRQALRQVLLYKPGLTIGKFETRKRGNVNAYTRDGVTMTLKPNDQLVFSNAASSSGV
jgi:hypothetical protein